MAKSDKQKAKGKKAAKVKDLPPKPKGGEAVKGGLGVKLTDVLVSSVRSPSSTTLK
jgi:hypothetical protein